MNTWTSWVAIGVSMAALALTSLLLLQPSADDLRGQVSALATQYQQLSDYVRTQDVRLERQQLAIDQQAESMGWIRMDVEGLLTRKPPPVETRWIENRFNRTEQRIGNLEYYRWGQKP